MKLLKLLQERINTKNKGRLTNHTPTLICSNCTGGFIYHWLGLRFNSPFINLFLTDVDFVNALKNFDAFLETRIVEDVESIYPYPVGIGYGGIKVHFMHYKTFDDAIAIWEKRKTRINRNNMGVMLTNWGGAFSIIEDFEKLPFKHKVAFVNKKIPGTKNTFFIKGKKDMLNLHRTQHLNGKRFIDQFDYVSFINSLKEDK